MNLKKNIVLVFGCGIALLLAIGAAVLLFLQISAASKAQSDLSASLAKLEQLNKRKPYPNNQNVALAAKNLEAMNSVLLDTQMRLRAGQVEPEQIERAQFPPMLEKTIRQLNEKASANAVGLPEHFAFGFESYSAGTLPQTNAIPRLVTQLKTVASICNLLYAAKITNIISISRDEFESELGKDPAQAGASSSGTMSMFRERSSYAPAGHAAAVNIKDICPATSNELFNAERLVIEFGGRENSIWELLNSLTKGPPFSIIRELNLETISGGTSITAASQANRGVPGAGYQFSRGSESSGAPFGTAASGGATNYIAREDRVVAGRETVRATIVIDVYRFAANKGESK
jgi:hypothetical protein